MIAADRPRAGPSKLLVVDSLGGLRRAAIIDLPRVLKPGDLVVANDAATLPASLHGVHAPTCAVIEVRLAGRPAPGDDRRFIAVVFGAGDYHTRTEDRAPPPPLHAGDLLQLGPLTAVVDRLREHPRLIDLRFDATRGAVWSGIARHGRVIQYAHVPQPLALWDVWTKIAGQPVAFESPSAGYALSWSMLSAFAERGIGFVTLTHAAGISSTGDAELDKRLPFDEFYRISESTVAATRRAKAEGGRIIAIGSSVVRALEHAARNGMLRAGSGTATGRIGPATQLKLVDAILSGVHAAGESHYDLLRAFAPDHVLCKAVEALEAENFRNHEFGDFVLVERGMRARANEHIAGCAGRMRYLRRDQQEGLRS